jgi:hypothetical protein
MEEVGVALFGKRYGSPIPALPVPSLVSGHKQDRPSVRIEAEQDS